jgi:site-specific DNA-methyltransferase (adenine-specific)
MAKNDNWTTPQPLYDWLHERCNFNVDAAASKKNTKCKRFYSKENSFLDIPIDKLGNHLVKIKARIFCNPPYSLDMEFAQRLRYLAATYSIPSYILLPQRCDRIWFQQFRNSKIVKEEPFTGRIHFGNAGKGAFMYSVGMFVGFKDVKVRKWIDAGQFNEGGKGGATF